MLRLLIDTSTWLDLAKRRDGQRLVVPLRVFSHQGRIELLVPQMVIDEFERNRPRVEASMTSSVAERFKLIRRDLIEYGSDDDGDALKMLDDLAHQVPLIGAMTTRNFDEIRELLQLGTRLVPGGAERDRVVARGLRKAAPFHRSRNSVADALLIELYKTALTPARDGDSFSFVTSNSEDFSAAGGDARLPHPDLADLFTTPNSGYALGVTGLEQVLSAELGADLAELIAESDFAEEPRRLDEILVAEQEFFDRIWYNRSLGHEYRLIDEGTSDEVASLKAIAGPGRARVEGTYGADSLGPYSDFEWGMLNGKLSALRWLLGSDWDFLDT